jgi:predicted regulator of Ras-like GTPase activity (Roadblock/LC7/MglB family)
VSDQDFGWDALFNSDDKLEPVLGGKPPAGTPALGALARYLQLPGVNGAIQVTLDGVVRHQDVPGEVEYYAALTASIGSTARQVNQLLTLNGYEYAVVRMAADTHQTMVFREGDTFIGLLLSGEIAPTHIVARLRSSRSGGSR